MCPIGRHLSYQLYNKPMPIVKSLILSLIPSYCCYVVYIYMKVCMDTYVYARVGDRSSCTTRFRAIRNAHTRDNCVCTLRHENCFTFVTD